MLFHDRTSAAFLLEEKLIHYKDSNGIVLAIPRGGVPIGYYLARLLHLPLDIIISKKIPHPTNEELAIGAVCGNETVLDPDFKESISEVYLSRQIQRLKEEGKAKYKAFCKDHEPVKLTDKTVILTDDGVATGSTVLAGVRNIRSQRPSKIVLAVPVASSSANRMLTMEVDDMICLQVPHQFEAVGRFYENFNQVTDEEVIQLLHKAEVDLSLT
jgi:putative phosphoribosyl transferase